MTDVYVVSGQSESGDDYGPWVFSKKPTRKELKAFLMEEAPGEFEGTDGPGDFGSYLHVTCVKAKVR